MVGPVFVRAVASHRPSRRLDIREVAAAWSRSGGGELAVTGPDEDATTMGVAAAHQLPGDLGQVAAVVFASPFASPGSTGAAAVLTTALGLSSSVRTVDLTGGDRCLTSAIQVGADIARALPDGQDVVVVAADDTVWQAGSGEELNHGHGAVALRLSAAGGFARLAAHGATTHAAPDTWQSASGERRSAGERLIHSAFVPPLLDALWTARPGLAEAVGPAPTVHANAGRPGAALKLARAVSRDAVPAPDVWALGSAGSVTAGLSLVEALAAARPGQVHVVLGVGAGIELSVIEVLDAPSAGHVVSGSSCSAPSQALPYGTFLRFSDRLAGAAHPPASPVVAWRDLEATTALKASRCPRCDVVSYPPRPTCPACLASTPGTLVRVVGEGTLVTFTTDHVVAGVNPGTPESPTTMAVADMDAGARLMLPLTHGSSAEVGARVRTVFRLAHLGGGFRNYHWRFAPIDKGDQS